MCFGCVGSRTADRCSEVYFFSSSCRLAAVFTLILPLMGDCQRAGRNICAASGYAWRVALFSVPNLFFTGQGNRSPDRPCTRTQKLSNTLEERTLLRLCASLSFRMNRPAFSGRNKRGSRPWSAPPFIENHFFIC